MEFDPFDHEFHRDPYPTDAWLREQAPVYHNERLGFWALSRFPDVFAGLHDPGTFTSTNGVGLEPHDPSMEIMIIMDPPEHTAMRKLPTRRFTLRRIAELEPLVREHTGVLLDRLDARSEFDVVHESTAVLPTTIIGTMLGVPPEDNDHLRQWTDDLLTCEPGNPTPPPAATEGASQIGALAYELSTARPQHGTDDLVTMLVDATIDGLPLTDAQIIGYCFLLITGGPRDDVEADRQRRPAVRPAPRPARPAVGRPGADDRRRRGGAALHQSHAVHGPDDNARRRTPRRRDTEGVGGRRCCWDRATVNRASSSGPRSSKSRVPTRASWPSATAATAASAQPSPGSRDASPSRSSSPATRATGSTRMPFEFLHSGNVQGPTSVPVTVLPAPMSAGAP